MLPQTCNEIPLTADGLRLRPHEHQEFRDFELALRLHGGFETALQWIIKKDKEFERDAGGARHATMAAGSHQ